MTTATRKRKTKARKRQRESVEDLARLEMERNRARRRKDRLRELTQHYKFSYRGGQIDRLHGKRGTIADADAEILEDLPQLREKSRDLHKNTTIGASIIKTMVDNVIGRGLKPQSRPRADRLGVGESLVKQFTEQAEDAWEAWAEEEWPDSTERLSYYELQRLDFQTMLMSGEGILQRQSLKLGPENRPLSLAFNSIEPDQMATPPGRPQDNENLRGGVELGKRGQPVAYWFMRRHPGRAGFLKREDFIRIPRWSALGRKNIIHTYSMSRPGQSRGVPLLAPSMTAIEDADYLDETTLTMQRVRTLLSAWVETPDPHSVAAAETAKTVDTDQIEELELAVMRYLMPGQEIKFLDPKAAGSDYEAFQRRMDRSICSALGLPYELVRKDFSQSNFSNTRAALLDVYNTFRITQTMQIRRRDRVVWRLFIREMVERGMLPITVEQFNEKFDEWCRVRWETPGWNWLDPLKEVQAAEAGIKLGVDTRADVCAQQGKDWEETAEQLAKENALAEELGIDMSGGGGASPEPADNSEGDAGGDQGNEDEVPAPREVEEDDDEAAQAE